MTKSRFSTGRPFSHKAQEVVQRCFVNKVFLEISQNSQEKKCARVSVLIKLQPSGLTLLKKRLWRICFPVDFVKFIRAPLVKFIRPPLVAASVKHNFMLK